MGTYGMRRRHRQQRRAKKSITLQQIDPGKPIQLTIDYDLQTVPTITRPRPGAVVAARSGRDSRHGQPPTPDPNDFAVRLSKEESGKQLNEDELRPLFNRAVQAQLAPGSSSRIVTARRCWKIHNPTESFATYCPGYGILRAPDSSAGWLPRRRALPRTEPNSSRRILKSCDVFFTGN